MGSARPVARLPASWWSRIRRAAAFVTVVWATAASFILPDSLAITPGWLIGANLDTVGNLALPAAVTNSRACASGTSVARSAAPQSAPRPRPAAWILGVRAGMRDQAGSSIAAAGDGRNRRDGNDDAFSQRIAAAAAAEVARVADALAVPRPAPFVPDKTATALVEFAPFVESDTNPTARALAVSYGTDACELYKLGSYWGFSTLYRMALPGERNVYAVEISYYGRRVNLPETLRQRMTQPTASVATVAQLSEEVTATTDNVTAYLSTPP